jgi:hypothetical protein
MAYSTTRHSTAAHPTTRNHGQHPASTFPKKPVKYPQATAKLRAVDSQPTAQPKEASRTASQNLSIATPTPQASTESRLANDSAPQAAPSTSSSTSPSTNPGTNPEPSAAKQRPQLDLSQANLARAATQANASSLAYKARVHTGLEPEPQARVFAKRLAAAAIPNCLSSSTDGEGQPLTGPSGNILLLPLMAHDAILGRCKMTP